MPRDEWDADEGQTHFTVACGRCGYEYDGAQDSTCPRCGSSSQIYDPVDLLR